MALQRSYTLLAPVYDLVLGRASAGIRRKSLSRLPPGAGQRILLAGIGTGLDVPFLPAGNLYFGIDVTHAMLARVPRATPPVLLAQGDAMRLPFPAASFDCVVLHLIVAVVPVPARCLAEASRVLRPGGTLQVLDKFLRPGEPALLRRAINPLVRRVASRLDVVWERLIEGAPDLEQLSDEPAALGGWFRLLQLRKR